MVEISSTPPLPSRHQASPPAADRKSVFFFCIANILWWIGLYLYVPVLPVYIQSTGAGLDTVGTVLSAYAVPQVLLRIPLGIWSDRLGKRKPLVIAGIILTSLAALFLGLSTTPVSLYISRAATGIGAAAWVIFPLYFTAYYPPGDSGKAIGLINATRNIALILATVGGGFIAERFGLDTPFFVAAALGVFAMAALLLTGESPVKRAPAFSWRDTASVITRPLLILVSLMAFLLHFVIFTGLFGFLPIYAVEIGAAAGELGLITMVNLAFSALGAFVSVRIKDRLGYRFSIIAGALLLSSGLLVIPLINSVPVLIAIQVGGGLGSGILTSLLMGLSIHGLGPGNQATAMGTFQAIYAVGMLAGPLASGFLGNYLSLSSVFYVAAFVAVLIVLLAFMPGFSRRAIG